MSSDGVREAMARFDRVIRERDQSLATEILHEQFSLVLVHPALAIVPRSRWIEMLPDYLVHDWQVEEQVIDVDDDFDFGTVHQRVAMRATVLGEDRSGVFVLTDVWRRGPDGWRVWRRFSTPLSAGAMPA